MNEYEKSLLTFFSTDQLSKIQKVHIGIAGAGGLGSNCAWNLARCGFKHFTIYDFDIVQLSNLNRQFYFLEQIGMPKVEALKENLLKINPDISLFLHHKRIDSSNVKKVFENCDAVVEAFDQAAEKKMLAEEYAYSGKLFVSASGLAGWGNSDRIVVKKIHETFYIAGDGKTAVSKNCPPCSPIVNIAAAKEADVILNWVLSRV